MFCRMLNQHGLHKFIKIGVLVERKVPGSLENILAALYWNGSVFTGFCSQVVRRSTR